MTATAPTPQPWVWTPARVRAAHLVAHDERTDEEIAREIGVHRATLARWKLRPEFAQRVQEKQQEYEEVFFAAMRQAVADHYHAMAAEAEAMREARRAARRR